MTAVDFYFRALMQAALIFQINGAYPGLRPGRERTGWIFADKVLEGLNSGGIVAIFIKLFPGFKEGLIGTIFGLPNWNKKRYDHRQNGNYS